MTDFARWVRNCAQTPASSMRLSLWCEALGMGEPSEGARLIEHVAAAARDDANALSVWLGLVDFPTVLERVGANRLHDILEEAERLELAACALVLGHHGAGQVEESLGPPPDPVVDRMSLGHRKTAVRGSRGHLLERLLKDPDPAVVAEALRNPRLREREVVDIASRRPCSEIVFWHLARAPDWIARAAVRRTIVLNPYAPPRLALTLAVSLPAQELRFVAEQEGLHRAVREGALEIAKW